MTPEEELAVQDSIIVCDSPVRETVVGELVALLTTLTLPLALPSAVGANVTVSVAVWFGASVSPEVIPVAV